MPKSFLTSTTIAVLLCTGAAPAADSLVIAPGAKLEKLAGDFKFTEGPASDAAGNVFFTDQPDDQIQRPRPARDGREPLPAAPAPRGHEGRRHHDRARDRVPQPRHQARAPTC